MNCANLIHKAALVSTHVPHSRCIVHAATQASEVTVASGSSRDPYVRSDRENTRVREPDTSTFNPNAVSATSVAHYYTSADDFYATRRGYIRRSERILRRTVPKTPASPGDIIAQRRRALETGSDEASQLLSKDPRSPYTKIANVFMWKSAHDKRRERESTLKRFGTLISDTFGDMYSVQPFGSTCYGASSNTSDIDVVIFDNERPYGKSPDDNRPLPPIYDVRRIAKLLKHEGYENISFIPNAAVPIVKFTDPETGMSCDANVNNRLGVYNTALLRQYCLRAPSLARFLRLVKVWARSVGLNSPSVRGHPPSFSSYAITLMTIAWMQALGHLPNLQSDQEVILKSHFWEQRLGWNRKVEFSFGACKDWTRPSYLRPPTFSQWLRFWAHEFDFEKHVVSIRQGGFIDRPGSPPPEWGHVRMDTRDVGNIVVLDPLSDRNCTYPISLATLKRFKQKCAEEILKWKVPRRARDSSPAEQE